MPLQIDFAELVSLFMFIFAIVGLMRGWYREGITSLFVAALAVLVWQPGIAREIIDKANALIKLILMFVNSGFSLQPQTLMTQSVDEGLLLDPDSYRMYIVITVVMIAVSYIIGETTFKDKMTPLGRLLGGVLGAFNGYVLISLIRQYLTNHFASQGISVQSNQLSVQVTRLPMGNFFAGTGIIFVFIVVIGVVALLVAGDKLKLPLK
jgi:ABC-type multidrug transport system fused ATPase/permease subunit